MGIRKNPNVRILPENRVQLLGFATMYPSYILYLPLQMPVAIRKKRNVQNSSIIKRIHFGKRVSSMKSSEIGTCIQATSCIWLFRYLWGFANFQMSEFYLKTRPTLLDLRPCIQAAGCIHLFRYPSRFTKIEMSQIRRLFSDPISANV